MTDYEYIKTLIENYPDVDLNDVDREVLIEIAHRYLASERSKLWISSGQKPRYQREEGAEAVDQLNKVREASAKRVQARTREKKMFDRGKVEATVNNRISEIVRETVTAVRGHWTAILDTEFSLPDGRSVTWRDATAGDHQSRADYLEKTAATRLETAGLHRKAIEDIRSSGVSTLGERENKGDIAA